jgi:hypothetical protein
VNRSGPVCRPCGGSACASRISRAINLTVRRESLLDLAFPHTKRIISLVVDSFSSFESASRSYHPWQALES